MSNQKNISIGLDSGKEIRVNLSEEEVKECFKVIGKYDNLYFGKHVIKVNKIEYIIINEPEEMKVYIVPLLVGANVSVQTGRLF